MVTSQDPPSIHQLSERSTPAIPDSIFHATDFILGAGVVIIQPATGKVVLVTDKRERWFLPKGRKDKGESLEQTALREAYEEVRLMNSFPSSLRVFVSCPISCFDLEPGWTTYTTPPSPFIPDRMVMRVLSHSLEGFLTHTPLSALDDSRFADRVSDPISPFIHR